MYADIPFPSGCRDPREEDCTGLDLDFFGLHNPEAMLQFLFTCDELLSDGSDDYITDEEGYDATRECFHIEHEEHDEGDQLGMPRENNAPPPHAGNQGSNVRLRPPGESGGPPQATLRAAHQARGGTTAVATASASSREGRSKQGS
jgi:hypothetical protein